MVDTFNQMNRFLIRRLVSQLDNIFKKNYTNICIKWKEAMGQRCIWNQLWYTHNSKLHSIFFITRCHLTLMWLKYTPDSRRPSNWMVVGRTDGEIRTTLRAQGRCYETLKFQWFPSLPAPWRAFNMTDAWSYPQRLWVNYSGVELGHRDFLSPLPLPRVVIICSQGWESLIYFLGREKKEKAR